MIYLHWIAGTLLALIWLSRVVDTSIGIRTLTNISLPEWDRHPVKPQGNPRVAIIVPARNEEASIEQALTRLLALDYDNYEVIAINDRSSDQTGAIMDKMSESSEKSLWSAGRPRPATPELSVPELKVIHVSELPPGWMGKAHAMCTAAKSATDADWLLFTDADVMFRPDCIRRAIAYAEQERADHVVLLPRTIMKRPGEKMMLAFFQLMFTFGHRPWKVGDPKAKDHIGVGAFNLVRRTVYESIGTYAALRFEVVDDMKLGKVIKNAGFRQRTVVGSELLELRWAKGARGVINNLTKNFFAVMSFQLWRAIGFCLVAAIANVLPFAGVIFAHGAARIPYAVALASIFFLYAGMSLYSDVRPWYFFLHPLGTLLFIYTMLRSTIFTLWRGGVDWRGTFYPLDELRKGLV
jgi:cellulose synthase/poly-beta-1,6-N-acetylglucosamine synthase-like glycosyltransferase